MFAQLVLFSALAAAAAAQRSPHDTANCPFNSKVPATCWGDSAFQRCPAGRQAAYDAVMAKRGDIKAMHDVYVALLSGAIPGCKTAATTTTATAATAAATTAAATFGPSTAAAAVNTTAAATFGPSTAAAAVTTTAAAAVTTTAAAAVPGEVPKTVTKQVKVEVQALAVKLPMPKADCTAITSSKADTKKTAEATAAAAGMDASSLDFERSSGKCESRRAARGRRQEVSLEVTLVFKEGISKADVAKAATAVNVMIQKPGGLKVTVSIGGVEKKIAVTETVSQKTETITVTRQVPNPDYVPSGNGTTTATTAKTGTTTNALSTPKASASLARGSALLVAALAASHALLA